MTRTEHLQAVVREAEIAYKTSGKVQGLHRVLTPGSTHGAVVATTASYAVGVFSCGLDANKQTELAESIGTIFERRHDKERTKQSVDGEAFLEWLDPAGAGVPWSKSEECGGCGGAGLEWRACEHCDNEHQCVCDNCGGEKRIITSPPVRLVWIYGTPYDACKVLQVLASAPKHLVFHVPRAMSSDPLVITGRKWIGALSGIVTDEDSPEVWKDKPKWPEDEK